jgi:hypothetical protein
MGNQKKCWSAENAKACAKAYHEMDEAELQKYEALVDEYHLQQS